MPLRTLIACDGSATASQHDAAAIVSGARGIGGARSALLGSVSSGLIHNPTCRCW